MDGVERERDRARERVGVRIATRDGQGRLQRQRTKPAQVLLIGQLLAAITLAACAIANGRSSSSSATAAAPAGSLSLVRTSRYLRDCARVKPTGTSAPSAVNARSVLVIITRVPPPVGRCRRRSSGSAAYRARAPPDRCARLVRPAAVPRFASDHGRDRPPPTGRRSPLGHVAARAGHSGL